MFDLIHKIPLFIYSVSFYIKNIVAVILVERGPTVNVRVLAEITILGKLS